jgi:hypothetical protein
MSVSEQANVEQAISDLMTAALQEWLPLAQGAVLHAAAPPPDAAAATEQAKQWDYLVDALVLYGLYLITADALDKAYTAMAGVPLAAGRAALPLLRFDMPGMPTRKDLREKVTSILSLRLNLSVEEVERRVREVPRLHSFSQSHIDNIRGRLADVVGRVFKRTKKAVDETPSNEAAKAEAEAIFDPLDPSWLAVAEETGQTLGTSSLNAATDAAASQAMQDTGRTMEIVWTAILDTHTRPAHAKADGQRQPPGKVFMVGGEPLHYPGDPAGSPENTINCRCRLFAHFTSPDPEVLASAVTSATMTDVEDFNWIEECGGLPKYIKRISKHLQEKGMPQGQAIATAVNSCKRMCSTGDTNWPGRQSVSKMTRAQACAAVKEWEKLKACAARKRVQKNSNDECAECQEPGPIQGAGAVTEYRSFSAVLAVIGTPTDDGRMFAQDIKLAFRDFPLPLLWQKQSSGGHMDAFTVGVIESAGVVGQEVIGKGYMLDTPEAQEAALQIEHGVTGPSVDLGDVQWELRDGNGKPVTEEDYYANPDMELIQTVLSAKILAATLVATPAFGQTSISLDGTVEKSDAALVAAAGMPMPGLIDMPLYEAELFSDPQFDAPTLPHMTEDGRIQGHLAAFNVCHIGIQDRCVMAPRSQTDYAWFHTAPPVKTDKGMVKVGRLTVGGGHAGPRLSPAATISHYDDAGTCFALVHVGEDEHGIWFSGVPSPSATPEQIAKGLAAPLSGDWRNVGGNLELVAALSVNTPGFPIIASGATDDSDVPLALVASLGPCAGEDAPQGSGGLNESQLRAFVKIIMDEQKAEERRSQEAAALISAEVQRQALSLIGEVE